MAGREWNRYIDDITSADIEFEDIRRLISDIESKKSIDHLDGEKLLADLCNLRYRFGFFYLSFLAVTSIVKPKGCIHGSIKDIRRAIKNLRRLHAVMEEVQYAADEEGHECEFCGRKAEAIQEEDDQEGQPEEDNDNEDSGEESDEAQPEGENPEA